MSNEELDKSRKVSILCSVFNEARLLPELLESLAAQSHAAWELLVVDDGSTDETAEIVLEASRRDPRIRLLSRGKKMGKVEAFNLAFSMSAGEIIGLTAGDDVMPADAIEARASAFTATQLTVPSVAYFKLRTVSTNDKFAGMVLPRGSQGSRSGPSLTMTRPLAEICFPIPGVLVSEDTWLGEATEALAEHVINSDRVVMQYRIHDGNSNPRQKSFGVMTEAMHQRARAWTALLEADRFDLPPRWQRRVQALLAAETYRYERNPVRVLAVKELRWVDRLAMASMSRAGLFRIRSIFYRQFTGWRGR